VLALCLGFSCASAHPPQLVVSYSTKGDPIKLKRLVAGRQACWSPDGTKIAYTNHGIWIMEWDKKKKQQLTKTGEAPAWSPDGKYLAYADRGIWILSLEDKSKRRLTSRGYDPSWSADGHRIVYADAAGIWVVEVDGGGKHQIVPYGLDPCWSPVDDQILFEQLDSKRFEFDIWLMPRVKAGAKLLLTNAQNPAWSVDGRYILYSSSGIWVAAADGSHRQRLTVRGFKPSWSPDGKKIIFSYQNYLWLMDSPYRLASIK